MKEKNNSNIILEFAKSEEGVSVSIYDCKTIELIIGIAETIQLIMEGTGQNKQTILADIEKVVDILEEKGGKENE